MIDTTTIALHWFAVSQGLIAFDRLVAAAGPEPAEPPEGAPEFVVNEWLSRWTEWDRAVALSLYGLVPSSLSSLRDDFEHRLQEHLTNLSGEPVSHGCVLDLLVELLDEEEQAVRAAWRAYRS